MFDDSYVGTNTEIQADMIRFTNAVVDALGYGAPVEMQVYIHISLSLSLSLSACVSFCSLLAFRRRWRHRSERSTLFDCFWIRSSTFRRLC
jgi:hypothetical protein